MEAHLRLVVYDQHPLPVEAELHLLRPDASCLLELQQLAHAIGGIEDARLLIDGECRQMLEQMLVDQVAVELVVVRGTRRLTPFVARISAIGR